MASLSLRVDVESAAAEGLSDALLEAGAASVSIDAPEPEREHATLTALFAETAEPARALDVALQRCGSHAPLPFTIERLEDQDWVRRSQAQFSALRLGRLWIGASWHRAPSDVSAIVRIDPGLAFGTGSHASTRLVLRFLEGTIKGGETLLDYGCGSGILAIAAAKLGALSVDAVDSDAQAVEVTRANAQANQVALRAFLPDGLPPARYEIVVANILARPLIDLAPVLANRTEQGGRIALAGVLDAQADEVARAYAELFEMATEAHQEGWALVCGRRR